jgi:RNA polymerase sigma factor (sigma-70 family)
MSVGVKKRKEETDEELVRLFQATGETECFAELFARHRKRIYCACRGFFSDGSAAEDASQETFLRAFQNLHRFLGGNFSGWLMRIAKNVCIDLWRKRGTEVKQEEALLNELPAAGTLDRAFDMHHVAERIREELKGLSPDQRRCLEFKIAGYSYDETAARTGLTVEAVKSHLQNGRRLLWLRMGGTLSNLK